MIKITVELWPFGAEANKKVIAEAFIANDGTGTMARGNYEAWTKDKTYRSLKFGRVKGYARRSKSVWQLIALALESCLKGGEIPDTPLSERLKNRATNAS